MTLEKYPYLTSQTLFELYILFISTHFEFYILFNRVSIYSIYTSICLRLGILLETPYQLAALLSLGGGGLGHSLLGQDVGCISTTLDPPLGCSCSVSKSVPSLLSHHYTVSMRKRLLDSSGAFCSL